MSRLNKILLAIIVGLVLAILVGTIMAKVNQKKNTPEVLISKGKAVNLAAPADDSVVAYYELGTIRIMTAGGSGTASAAGAAGRAQGTDGKTTGTAEAAGTEPETSGTVLVISPWLAYPAGDTVFYEELARKKGVIKGFFQAYFTSRSKNQILEETEVKIEAALKDEINAALSLGKISDIYFTDYIFLE